VIEIRRSRQEASDLDESEGILSAVSSRDAPRRNLSQARRRLAKQGTVSVALPVWMMDG